MCFPIFIDHGNSQKYFILAKTVIQYVQFYGEVYYKKRK